MKTLKILLADDHEIIRHGLRALLQDHEGWEISGEAVDGRDAVTKATLLKPDLVILDIGMPCLNGLDSPLATRPLHDRLTPRERQVLELLAEGKATKEVAALLTMSVKTAETHRSNILHKLGLHSVTQLVLYAVRNNIVQLSPPTNA